jgi:hypothetical protein
MHQILGNVFSYLLHKIRILKPTKLFRQESHFSTAGLFNLEEYLTEFCLNMQQDKQPFLYGNVSLQARLHIVAM